MEYKKIRGTEDLYDIKSNKYVKIYNTIFNIAERYGFNFIKTPILEEQQLFKHTIGNSDIVKKEMFRIIDAKNRNIVLKPEGTAPIVRAIVENRIIYEKKKPIKLFYWDSMFRYERPQKGRLRQFHQFGFEIIGDKNIYYDIELISILMDIFQSLNIDKSKLSLNLNYLGSIETRQNYIRSLKNYFSNIILCTDCMKKLKANVLRILDCKIDHHNIINAPKIIDYLNKDEKQEYSKYLKILNDNNIEYVENPYLVRGLDYYKNIVFEVLYKDKDWSQNSICGGGRYDDLFQKFNVDTFGVGFAVGIERLIMIMEDQKDKTKDFYIGGMNENSNAICFKISNIIRNNNYTVITNYENNINKHLKNIQHFDTKYSIIVGDKDIKNNTVIINSKVKQRFDVEIDKLESWLKNANI